MSNDLVLIQVMEELTTLASLGFHMVSCWIPGHIGIKGNEKVEAKIFQIWLKAPNLQNFPEFWWPSCKKWPYWKDNKWVSITFQKVHLKLTLCKIWCF